MRKRLKGAVLSIEVGADEYNMDTTAVTITNEEADDDVTTFAQVAEGENRDWFLDITALQSTDAESLHTFNWDNAGDTVSVTVAPHGNEEPTEDQPHYVMPEVEVGPPPVLGGEAGRDETWTYENQWRIRSGKPTKITA